MSEDHAIYPSRRLIQGPLPALDLAKEKCDALADDAKAKCIKDAKARYVQS